MYCVKWSLEEGYVRVMVSYLFGEDVEVFKCYRDGVYG